VRLLEGFCVDGRRDLREGTIKMNNRFQAEVQRIMRLDDERKKVQEAAFEALSVADEKLADLALVVFDSNRANAAGWFASRLPVFGGRMAFEVWQEDRDRVERVLHQMEHGVIS